MAPVKKFETNKRSGKVELKLYTRSFKSKGDREEFRRPNRNDFDDNRRHNRRSRPRFRERRFSPRNFRPDRRSERDQKDFEENYSQRKGFGRSNVPNYVHGKGFPRYAKRNDKNNNAAKNPSNNRRRHRDRQEEIIPKLESENEEFDVKKEPVNEFNFKGIYESFDNVFFFQY